MNLFCPFCWKFIRQVLKSILIQIHSYFLLKPGKITALNMYGCKNPESWVSHGFTDGNYHSGLLGDTKVILKQFIE
jgi:hypothetical protein